MVIAFLHARQSPDCAALMVAAVKRHMPAVTLLQLTDETTPILDGCVAKRRPWNAKVMLWRMEHLCDLNESELLVLDTDVIVQANLKPVVWHPFDAALTWRAGPIWDRDGNDVADLMPYNCGVMFARGASFWQACLARMLLMHEDAQAWWGDQIAVRKVAESGEFRILELKCDEYNYTPSHADEDVSRRRAVHYKGPNRKQWMLDKWQSLTTPA